MTKKELFLKSLEPTDKPIWIGDPWSAFTEGVVIFDPVSIMDAVLDWDEDYIALDAWGSTWRHGPDDPGAVPIVTESNKVIKDLERWRDYLKVPDISNLNWDAALDQVNAVDRNEKLVMIPTFYGMFERLHILYGFENALIAMHEEPELVTEVMTVLTDYKIEVCKQVIDHLHPDIIHSHDDWGDATRTFFSVEKWRELIKPHFVRLYDYIKSRGMLVQHHSDGVCAGLENDMVEMGIDMWQGVIPANNIHEIKKNVKGRMLLMGGLDQLRFDKEDYDEEFIRSEVRYAIDEYAPGGGFLPCIASVWTLYPEVGQIAADEMEKYGDIWMGNH